MVTFARAGKDHVSDLLVRAARNAMPVCYSVQGLPNLSPTGQAILLILRIHFAKYRTCFLEQLLILKFYLKISDKLCEKIVQSTNLQS